LPASILVARQTHTREHGGAKQDEDGERRHRDALIAGAKMFTLSSTMR
jgi:hypothetical protein